MENKFEVVFCQEGYSHVDAVADSYEQAQEIRSELQAQMHMSGERNFYYIIREVE